MVASVSGKRFALLNESFCLLNMGDRLHATIAKFVQVGRVGYSRRAVQPLELKFLACTLQLVG